MLAKPNGSDIEEVDDVDGKTYHWKPGGLGPARRILVPFLIIWLCGWVLGLVIAPLMFLKNGPVQVPPNGFPGPVNPNNFMAIWLAGWIVSGVLVFTLLLHVLRPGKPESITLARDFFRHNPGKIPIAVVFVAPFVLAAPGNPFEPFTRMWRRRKTIEIGKGELGPFVLMRVGERQRLSFDHGADRIEIGEGLREPDREWLAAVIQDWLER